MTGLRSHSQVEYEQLSSTFTKDDLITTLIFIYFLSIENLDDQKISLKRSVGLSIF